MSDEKHGTSRGKTHANSQKPRPRREKPHPSREHDPLFKAPLSAQVLIFRRGVDVSRYFPVADFFSTGPVMRPWYSFFGKPKHFGVGDLLGPPGELGGSCGLKSKLRSTRRTISQR